VFARQLFIVAPGNQHDGIAPPRYHLQVSGQRAINHLTETIFGVRQLPSNCSAEARWSQARSVIWIRRV